MASFFLRTRTSLASKNRGASHCDYISGEGRYKDKEEVAAVIDKNIPAFAKDMKEFLALADKNESDSVRSYRSLIVAIPKECQTLEDKKKWALGFSDKLLNDKHAFRLAIHYDPNNPHFHLTFSERQNTPESLKMTPKKYFSRANKKDRAINGKEWLIGAKQLYLDHIRTVCPNYTPEMVKEERIGPKLDRAGASYEAERQERLANVTAHRAARKEFKDLDLQIKAEQTASKPTAQASIASAKPAPPKTIPIKIKREGFSFSNFFKNPKPQPSLKPPKPHHRKPAEIKPKDEFWQAPKPKLNKVGQFLEDMKHDGVFIAHLKSQAPRGDPVIEVIAKTLRHLKASDEFSKQLDRQYQQIHTETLKDKAVSESKDPWEAGKKRDLRQMSLYLGDVLQKSWDADIERKKQAQAPQPEQHPEPPPNRHRPSMKPKGFEMEIGD